MMKYENRVISLPEIDSTDDTYCLSLHTHPVSLAASIKAVGLISPPVLRQREDLKYLVVCGFRRVEACQALGWLKIPGRVLLGEVSQLDLLKLAIEDNRSHRPLNVVEQARGIEKLNPYIPPRHRLESLSSLLGFPPSKKVSGKLSKLNQLPEPIQAGVLDASLSLEAAVHLCDFSPADAILLFDILKGLKLSQNKQTQVIKLIQEIGIREEVKAVRVLESKEIRTILDGPDLNRQEKASALRAYLKQRRFPTLAEAEEKFHRELKALRLTERLHLTPPPYFEGGTYTLRVRFTTMRDFDECRNSLDRMANNPALRRLLELF
jgi:ParB/RepB/Spo0J family partition protein